MVRPRENRKKTRLSVSLDDRIYTDLCSMARQAQVSVAWVVRRAVLEMLERNREMITPELPLRRTKGNNDA
jgi:predicted transcriptional regulator